MPPVLPPPSLVENEAFQTGNFLAPLMALRDQKVAYLASSQRLDFLQEIGTYESYVGNYGKAHQYFVQFEHESHQDGRSTQPTSDFIAIDAAQIRRHANWIETGQ